MGEGEGEGEGEGVGVGEGVGEGEREGEGEGEGEREGEGEGEGEGVGVGEGEGTMKIICDTCLARDGAPDAPHRPPFGFERCRAPDHDTGCIEYDVTDWHQHGEEVDVDVTAKAPTGEQVRAVVTLAFDGERLSPTFPDVERWVPAPMLALFTAYSEDPSCEVTDGLLPALFAAVDVDDLEVDASCAQCAGSGEGMYDKMRCSACGGSGDERRGRDDDGYGY